MHTRAIDQRILVLAGAVAILFSQAALAAADSAEWKHKQLDRPAQRLLEAERQGRVTIANALLESEADRAMNEHFGRNDRTALIPTHYMLADGSDTDSGDCD